MKLECNPLDSSGMYVLETRGARDLAFDLLDSNGNLKIVPASYYEKTTQTERSLFCVRYGFYNLPTTEQVEFLRDLIGISRAIEIGSGNGSLAAALGIRATDNYMQERSDARQIVSQLGQAPVRYGANVERIDGEAAAAKYSPHTILACWLTHRYQPSQHARGGNMLAPHEKRLLKYCKRFVHIGNDHTHRFHPLLGLKHERIEAPWLYSRAVEGTNFVGIWKGKKM